VKTSGSTRSLLSNFGFNVSSDIPISQLLNDSYSGSDGKDSSTLLKEYLFGVIGAAVPFVIVTLIVLLYFTFGCCCLCCFKKNSKKISIPWLVFHIIFCCLLLVSAVFFFLMADALTSGLDSAEDVLPGFSRAIGGVSNTFNTTIDGAIDLLDATVSDTADLFNSLIYETTNNLDNACSAADKVESELNSAKANVGSLMTEAEAFDNDFEDITTYCHIPGFDMTSKLGNMGEKMDSVSKDIKALSDAKSNIQKFKDEINNRLNSVNGKISEEVKKFKEGDINEILSPIDDAQSSIDNLSSSADDIIKPVKVYIKIVSWCLGCLALFTAVCLIGFYFCANCCGRCCFNSFFPISALWALVSLIVCTIFCALFFVLYDTCGEIESAANVALDDMMGDNVQISDLLNCPADKRDSIYKMAGLESVIDYTELVNDLKTQIQDQMSEATPDDGVLEQLDSVLEVDISGQLNEDDLKGFDSQEINRQLDTLGDTISNSGNSQCKRTHDKISILKGRITQIDNLYNTNIKANVETATINANKAQDAAKVIKPLIVNSTAKTQTLVSDLTDGILVVVDNGVNSLDCTIICNAYAPIKNTLCVHIVDGFGFGTIAFLILVIALFCISITICNRRRHMYPPKVEDESKDDEANDLLDHYTTQAEGISNNDKQAEVISNYDKQAVVMPPPSTNPMINQSNVFAPINSPSEGPMISARSDDDMPSIPPDDEVSEQDDIPIADTEE
jgi:hypothetical protein